MVNINDCLDVGDIVIAANEAYDDTILESDCCDDCDYEDCDIDDDVYDAAMEDLYEDGVSIGDVEAEEMSCTATDIIEEEIDDEVYDSMVEDEDDVRLESFDDYEDEEAYALPESDII